MLGDFNGSKFAIVAIEIWSSISATPTQPLDPTIGLLANHFAFRKVSRPVILT